MSIISTIKRVGLLPTLYKLKHLYLTPDPFVISLCSQNGAYKYLQRYMYAAQKMEETEVFTKIKDTKYIWVFWFQGLDNAPLLVQRCVKSIQNYNSNKKVLILSNETFSQYVSIPNYIIEKHNAGIIPHAHFSDILRLFLLQKYGGVWIDSTILMTGCIPDYIENSSFFLYHSPNEMGHVCCANGFIASCKQHPIINQMLSLLLEYWKCENRLVSYSIFHLFFYMLTHEMSENAKKTWENTPLYFYSECKKLCTILNKKYNQTTLESITQCSPIHKLSYKDIDDYINTNEKDTFYDILINQNVPTC